MPCLHASCRILISSSFSPTHITITKELFAHQQPRYSRMAYYQRPQSPHRDEDSYYNTDRAYRAPVEVRDRDRDRDYHRSRRSPYSPPRGRSPPRDAPRGPRSFHQPSAYRSRSGSHDRTGGSGGRGGYYDRDAPRSRSPSRDREREWFGGPASRDVIIEGLGSEVDEDYVVNPPPWNDHHHKQNTVAWLSFCIFPTCPSLLRILMDFC